MGCCFSNPFPLLASHYDPVKLSQETTFSVSEVEALFSAFKKITCSVSDDGLIHKEDFRLALFKDKGVHLFADRVFDTFDERGDGVLEFREFVHSLSVFHPKTPVKEKAEFAFRLYDLDRTGNIDRSEVKRLLQEALNEAKLSFSDEIIETIIDRTFEEADKNKDGLIDIEEWRELVRQQPHLLRNMTLNILTDITSKFPSFVFESQVDDTDT
eukprot:TRINITY_DN14454_c0_g1_i1.p1 TRINITY_DN14454_c0_g1~~TRINITY_DN14454_c0_g1_i1.p1  ORF type:complete len:213 (+),score=43.22 TRINITY_DN14454_c0_g1_i1:101-739(+)